MIRRGASLASLALYIFLQGDADALACDPIDYGGGPVITAPNIWLVYWGWGSQSDSANVKGYRESYLSHIGGTRWLNTVIQYHDSTGAATANPTKDYLSPRSSHIWYDDTDGGGPQYHPTRGQIADEATHAAHDHCGVSGVNNIIIVALPPLRRKY